MTNKNSAKVKLDLFIIVTRSDIGSPGGVVTGFGKARDGVISIIRDIGTMNFPVSSVHSWIQIFRGNRTDEEMIEIGKKRKDINLHLWDMSE